METYKEKRVWVGVIWKPALVFREMSHWASRGRAVMPLGNDVIQHLEKKNLFILLVLSDHKQESDGKGKRNEVVHLNVVELNNLLTRHL